jgi:hypothetical protein
LPKIPAKEALFFEEQEWLIVEDSKKEALEAQIINDTYCTPGTTSRNLSLQMLPGTISKFIEPSYVYGSTGT